MEPSRRSCEGLLWFILFFAPAAFGATEWWSRALLESLIFILAAMCALRRDFSAPRGAPLAGFSLIIALGALQLLQAQPAGQPAGLLPFTVARPQTAYALLLWTSLAALFWSASGILRWEGALRRLSWAIFGTGLFIALVGFLQRGQGNTAYYGLRPIRLNTAFGPFQNPNHAANWLAASTMVGAGLIADQLKPRGRLPSADRAAQLLLAGFVVCLSAAAVFVTRSRGGFHAFFLASFLTAGVVSIPLIRGRFRVLLLGGMAVSVFAYAYYLSRHPRLIGLAAGGLEGSAGERLVMYRAGLRLLADFPVFGVGLGGFQSAYYAYKASSINEIVDHIHNSWFEVALESGVAAALVLGAAFLAPVAALGRRLAKEGLSSGGLRAGYFAAALALLIHGLVDFNFQIPANAAVFVVVLAGLQDRGEQRPGPARPGRLAMAAALLIMAALSLPPGIKGAGPRLGAPFVDSTQPLLAFWAVKG